MYVYIITSGHLNHGTGKGWVKQVKGHYHDALYVKKSRVVVC